VRGTYLAHARSVEGLLERDLEVLNRYTIRYRSCAVVSTSALDSVGQLRLVIYVKINWLRKFLNWLCDKALHLPRALGCIKNAGPCIPDRGKGANKIGN
jgi:hypothetical protein